jgi:hypothetical protein
LEATGTLTGILHRRKRCDDDWQVRESLLLEVRLLRETLREAQGDIERCRYFSAEMNRRETEITQRADAKVQQCVLQRAPCAPPDVFAGICG